MLAAVGLVLVACTNSATPVPQATPSADVVTPTTDGTLPMPELTVLRLGASIQEMSQFAPKLAEMAGIYRKYGIDVTITTFNADGDALQALLSGQTDMGSVGAAGILNSRLTDSPARNINFQKTKVIDAIFCGDGIRTAEEAKGKVWAVSTLGGTAHASVLLALQALGLTDRDVMIQQVGGQAVRLAALKSGAIACAPVDILLKDELAALDINLIVDLSTTGLQYPATGLAAQDGFLEKNPSTALVMAAANLEAQNMIFADPQQAAQHWGEYAQIDDAKALEQVIGAQDQISRTMMWTDEAMVFTQEVMAIVSPGIMMVDPKSATDASFLERLVDIGFYRKLGVPLE
jgi:ABC-type nitrate/sulfonate/bicarbonate transport system substrate-binding protein